MNEKGIPEHPKIPLTNNADVWRDWWRWFGRVWANFPRVQTFTATLDPVAVSANTIAEQTFTVAGLTTSDIVHVNKPSLTAGIGIVGARVSAANTLAITFINNTGGSVNPASEDYLIVAIRR